MTKKFWTDRDYEEKQGRVGFRIRVKKELLEKLDNTVAHQKTTRQALLEEMIAALPEPPEPEKPHPKVLEHYLIHSDRWPEAPAEVQAVANRESDTGVPTGVAHHPKYGWFVLQSSGQGPYVVWPTP